MVIDPRLALLLIKTLWQLKLVPQRNAKLEVSADISRHLLESVEGLKVTQNRHSSVP